MNTTVNAGIRNLWRLWREKKGILRKKPGDAQIVVAMVMIVIALVLCFLFKNQITTFMTTAITTMSTKMNALLDGLN